MASALSIPAALPAIAPPPPRGIKWIDVATAATRSGLEERSIRHKAATEWHAAGLARLDGSRWMIREDADARVARVKFAGNGFADLAGLTDRQKKEAAWKSAVVAEWKAFNNSEACRGFGREEAEAIFLELLGSGRLAVKLLPTMKGPPTDRTLRNWIHRSGSGVTGLVDGRSTRYQDGPDAADPFFEFVKSMYLDQRKPELRFCWKAACFEASRQGWMMRSEPQTRRFIATIPQAVITLFRGGDKAYNDQSSPYIERDYTTLRVNQIVNADHHQFDVWVNHQGKPTRPWLTAFQEMRSRKIIGWHVSPDGGNTETILSAMMSAIDSAGVPEQLYFDWGRDFASKAVGGISRKQRMAGNVDPKILEAFGPTSICGALGIRVVHCQAFHGQSKPIERNFGTMRSFTKSRSTYCGNTPANRPENLRPKLKRGAVPELADFIADFALWVDWYNEAHAHHGDGMNGQSPAAVFESLRTEKRVIPDEIRVILSWKPGPLVKVGRIGARCNGLKYALDGRDGIEWQGKQVSVRVDPNDVSRAAICSPEGRFICIARATEKLPHDATAEQKSRAIAAIKRRKKLVRDYHQQRPRMVNDVAEEMWQQQADESRRRREAAATPVPFVTVSTLMNDQLGTIRRQLKVTNPRQLPLEPPSEEALAIRQFMREGPADPIDDQPARGNSNRFVYEPKPEPEEEQRHPSFSELYECLERNLAAKELNKPEIEDPFKRTMEVFGRPSETDETEAQS